MLQRRPGSPVDYVAARSRIAGWLCCRMAPNHRFIMLLRGPGSPVDYVAELPPIAGLIMLQRGPKLPVDYVAAPSRIAGLIMLLGMYLYSIAKDLKQGE
jgi:hypothetical protein